MAAWKVPLPLPKSMLTLPLPSFATTRSSLPSPLKSPTVTELGFDPAPKVDGALSAIEELEGVTSKNITFDAPPPGLGFTTVTEAVLAAAMSEAGTLAVNCESLTRVVASELWFQFTTAPETKPVPCTASVNPAPPGAVASGTRGWLMRGTAFSAAKAVQLKISKGPKAANATKRNP